MRDRAWTLGVNAALRTCRYFPTPVELISLADEATESDVYDRLRQQEQDRTRLASAHGLRLLTTGQITEDDAAERKERFRQMAADTLRTIRENRERQEAERRADFWASGQRRAGRRRPLGEDKQA